MFANDIFKIQKSEIQFIGKVDVSEIEDIECLFKLLRYNLNKTNL